MSMICYLRRASREDVARLLDAPAQVAGFLFGAGAVMPPASGGLLSRLFGGPKREPAAPIEWPPRREGDELDLEKAWHGLHYLFTGTAWEGAPPASYLVLGGQDIGDEDVGYGPARALMPDEVRGFADFLQSLTPEELERRYDPERMMALQIYPEVWDRAAPGEESELDWMLDAFAELRDFAARARDAGECLIIYVR